MQRYTLLENLLLNNKHLIYKLKKKEKAAYELLFDTYFERLFLFASNFVFIDDVANDIVQDVFISIWEKSENINESASLKSYLFTMVRNRCLNYIRDMKVEDRNKRLYLEAHVYSDTIDAIEDEALIEDLKIFIEELPDQCKEVFKMRTMYGYKYKEIAEEMDISIDTVKVQLKRAKNKLKVRFSDYSTSLIIFLISNWIQF